MRFLLLIFWVSTSLSAYTIDNREYPLGPDYSLTPGSLCTSPSSYRYPENIPYCDRDNLERGIKERVFSEYRQMGFRLDPRDRHHYKIDHLVPLCAGGSNEESNLWPQHRSLYELTDPLESLGCEKLRFGKIRQYDLVKMIIATKRDLNLIPQALQYLKSLR